MKTAQQPPIMELKAIVMLLTYSPSPGPLCQHGLLKYHLRICVKNYRRGKTMNIQFSQLPYSRSRQNS